MARSKDIEVKVRVVPDLDPFKRIPWYAWPAIIFAPGGWLIAIYYMMKERKR